MPYSHDECDRSTRTHVHKRTVQESWRKYTYIFMTASGSGISKGALDTPAPSLRPVIGSHEQESEVAQHETQSMHHPPLTPHCPPTLSTRTWTQGEVERGRGGAVFLSSGGERGGGGVDPITMMMHSHCIRMYERTCITMLVIYTVMTRASRTRWNVARHRMI